MSRFVPALRWLRTYQTAWLPADLAAGVTVGAVLVSSALAAGQLAGLPVAGLYSLMLPLTAFALLSSSRQMVVGPDVTMATLIAASLVPLAAGDPLRLAALSALMTLWMAIFFAGAALLRLGFMADFLAKAVTVGFMHGVAVVILVAQLPKVLGIEPAQGSTLARLGHILRTLDQTHLPTAGIAVVAVAVILGMRRWLPRIPGQIVVLIGSVIAVRLFALDQAGVAVVGDIPGRLPPIGMPDVTLDDVRLVAPVALGAALLSFSDTIVTGRAFASRNRYRLDANRELLALGIGNLAAAFTQALPISGNGTVTAVGESAGSRTQVTSIVAAATVVGVVLVIAPLLKSLPIAALGGILTVAAYGLCDRAEFRRLWNFRGVGFAAAIIVLAGVIAIGAIEGILLGVLFSLVLVIREVTFPSDTLLGQADGGFHDLAHRPDARPVPGAVIYRCAGPLFFANCGQFRSRVEAVVEGCAEKPSVFVLDASMVFQVDLVACETLIEVGDWLRERDIRFAIANLQSKVEATIARGGVIEHLGETAVFATIPAALAAGNPA